MERRGISTQAITIISLCRCLGTLLPYDLIDSFALFLRRGAANFTLPPKAEEHQRQRINTYHSSGRDEHGNPTQCCQWTEELLLREIVVTNNRSPLHPHYRLFYLFRHPTLGSRPLAFSEKVGFRIGSNS